MKRCSEAYSQGIAFAVRYWAGIGSTASVEMLPSLAHLSGSCVEFDGGSPANELFWPRRFQGEKISIRRSSTPLDCQGALEQPKPEKVGHLQQRSVDSPNFPGIHHDARRDHAETSTGICLRTPLGTRPTDMKSRLGLSASTSVSSCAMACAQARSYSVPRLQLQPLQQ